VLNEISTHLCHPLPPFLSYAPRMPGRNKKSKAAKQMRGEGRTTFSQHAERQPSPNVSDYDPPMSDDHADKLPSEMGSSSDERGDN